MLMICPEYYILERDDCKYNGGNNFSEKVADFVKGQEVIPICPEVMGGLSTPREPGRESFISTYDDPDNPENYLEITYSSKNADEVSKSIEEELSENYDIIKETYELEHAGSCVRIDASATKGGGTPDLLQMVYIIPSADGSITATAHYSFESVEGFGRRFDYIMNTLSIIE